MIYFDRYGNNISARKWLTLFRDPEYSVLDSFMLGDRGGDCSWIRVHLPYFEKEATTFLVRCWEIVLSPTGKPSSRRSLEH